MTATLPTALLAAFRAAEQPEHLGALMTADGWDAEVMRVLAATQHVDAGWTTPKKPCPDDGNPTAAAWSWLMSGWEPDFVALAQAAGVTVPIARRKWAMLAHGRLIYPDNSMTKWARAALKKHVAQRLGATKGKRKDKEPGGSDDAN